MLNVIYALESWARERGLDLSETVVELHFPTETKRFMFASHMRRYLSSFELKQAMTFPYEFSLLGIPVSLKVRQVIRTRLPLRRGLDIE